MKYFVKSCRIFLMLLAFTMIFAGSVQAAKVTKIKTVCKYTKDSKQYAVITGRTKTGKTVWTYRTSRQPATELTSAVAITGSKYVYVIDSNQFIRLNKQTGKVGLKKKLPESFGSAVCKKDSKNNIYLIGYYGDTLYKLNQKGKVLWKYKFSNKYWWPTKIKLSGKKVTVYFDCCGSPRKVSLKSSTGKK